MTASTPSYREVEQLLRKSRSPVPDWLIKKCLTHQCENGTIMFASSERRCRNWQTSKTKDLVLAITCGFKSHPPHLKQKHPRVNLGCFCFMRRGALEPSGFEGLLAARRLVGPFGGKKVHRTFSVSASPHPPHCFGLGNSHPERGSVGAKRVPPARSAPSSA